MTNDTYHGPAPEHPDIVRRDGMLFFACSDNDRASIAISIERLIDVLDEMDADPDLEDGGDCEHDDEREEENEHGGDVQDEPHDDGVFGQGVDFEPDLGWTNHVDQTKVQAIKEVWMIEAGEPELGFVGIATGWREGEESDDREGGDERDWDAGCPTGGDHGVADADALGDPSLHFVPFDYDGSGNEIAEDLIRGLPIAAKRADAYALAVAPILYQLSN